MALDDRQPGGEKKSPIAGIDEKYNVRQASKRERKHENCRNDRHLFKAAAILLLLGA